MNKLILPVAIFCVLTLALCSGCKGQSKKDTSNMSSFGENSNSNVLVGAGSKGVYPLFSKLFAGYAKDTHVMVNYQSIGSGGGILQLTKKAVDFAASDTPLTNGQIKKMGPTVLQIPVSGSKNSSKTGFTLAIIYREQSYDGRSLQRAQKVLKLLWWTIHNGQKYSTTAGYNPLSPAAVAVGEKLLRSATFGGKVILQ